MLKYLNPYQLPFLFIQLVLWSGLGVVFRILWLGYDAPPSSWFVVHAFMGFIVTHLLAFIYWRHQNKRFLRQFIIAIVLATLCAVLWRIGFNIVDFHVYERANRADIPLFRYLYRGSSSTMQLYGWSAVYLLFMYYEKYRQQRERALLAEIQLKEAEIMRLHQQVSPHLLFNVMHSLDTLLLKNAVPEARLMLEKLNLYLRDSLSRPEQFSITLMQELYQTQKYLEIEQIRFKDRLVLHWDLMPELESYWVPNLMLQPLAENAIKHCVEKNCHGGEIRISCVEIENQIEISVLSKPIDPVDSEGGQDGQVHFGLGLKGTRKKLQLMYQEHAQLNDHCGSDQSFEVVIKIDKAATKKQGEFPQ